MKYRSNTAHTILTIIVGLLIVYYFFRHEWLLILMICIGVLSAFSAWIRYYIDHIWMKLAKLLGLVIPNILLGMVFFILILPIALLARTFRKKSPVVLRKPMTTLFLMTRKEFLAQSFEKPW